MATSANTDGPARGRAPRGRERQCAVTRACRPLEELIRFVAGPDGAVVPDLRQRLPGRGVWVTCARDVLEEAVAKNHFARAFKRRVGVDEDLADLVEDLLKRAALSRLSLANKAGAVIAGFAKVEQAVSGGQAVALLHAREAAGDGRGKLDGKFLAGGRGTAAKEKIIGCFNADELSLALGRSNVVHAAVIDDRAGRSLLQAVERLEAYRAGRAAYDKAPAMTGCGEE